MNPVQHAARVAPEKAVIRPALPTCPLPGISEMQMSTYSEKLRDPRWQKKRLEILSRDEFTCQHCQCKTRTLHVHHLGYVKGREPWDYPDAALLTLCESCHEAEGEGARVAVDCLLTALRMRGADSSALSILAWAFDFSGPLKARPLSAKEWDALADILNALLIDRNDGVDLVDIQNRLRQSSYAQVAA